MADLRLADKRDLNQVEREARHILAQIEYFRSNVAASDNPDEYIRWISIAVAGRRLCTTVERGEARYWRDTAARNKENAMTRTGA